MQIGDLFVRLGLDSSGFTQGLNNATRSLGGIGSKMTDIGKKMSLAITAPLVGMGVAAVKMSMDFNGAMANVATLIPNSVARVDELKKSVQDMAVETGKSTEDLAGGLYQVISAFGDTGDTAKDLEINAKAAAAGLATTTDAINLTSAVTKGYGDTSAGAVQHVSDLAFQTVKLGQTTFPELAASMGKVTPLAASMGVNMNDMFAVMATGTGVTGTASEVSTQFRGILQSLMAPTKDMTNLIQSMGFKSGEAMIKQLGLKGTIDAIVKGAKTSGQPLQKYIQQIEGQTLAMALAGPQADTFSQKLKAMGDVAGVTDQAFKEQTEGVNKTGFAWAQFKEQVQVAAEKLGDSLAPALTQIMNTIKPLIQWLTNLSPAGKKVILVIAGLAAVIGPLLVVLGTLASSISSIIAIAPALGTAFTIATGPVGIAIAAIAALIAIGVALYKNWDTIKEKLSQIWTGIKETASNVWNAIKDFFKKWGEDILLLAAGPAGWAILLARKLGINWDTIKQTAMNAWSAIKTGISNIWISITSSVSGAMSSLYNTVRSGLESAWSYIKSIPSQALRWGEDIIRGLINGIKSLHIPMPHFHFSVDWHSVGGVDFPVPDVGVNWYDKGGIFSSPTVIGVGEKRPEFVGALDDLRKIVREESGGGNPIQVILKLDSRVVSQQLVYLNQGRSRGQGV